MDTNRSRLRGYTRLFHENMSINSKEIMTIAAYAQFWQKDTDNVNDAAILAKKGTQANNKPQSERK